jgi:hypothetical protein
MSDSTCPTCGASVTVVTGGEGTSHYQPQGDRVGLIERLIGHAKWCPRKGEPANTGKDCSTCGERIRVNPDWKSEEDRLREQLRGAVEALDTIDALISEVLDTWTWPIRDYADMRPWMRKLIAAVNAGRGQSSPAGCPACSRVPGVARPPHTCSGDQS